MTYQQVSEVTPGRPENQWIGSGPACAEPDTRRAEYGRITADGTRSWPAVNI